MGFSLFLGTAAFPNHNAVAPSPLVPVAKATPGYSVTLTAYNAVAGQTDSTPFETASGAYSNPEVIAARSANLADELPFGTIIEIDGTNASREACGYSAVAPLIGYRVIEDSMNPRYTDRIDVLFDTKSNYVRPDGTEMNAAHILGICKGVTIRVVGHVDIRHIPTTQIGLAALVKNASQLALK
jgi:3D (Asp-Asp-Asp) domain-containing protein